MKFLDGEDARFKIKSLKEKKNDMIIYIYMNIYKQ